MKAYILSIFTLHALSEGVFDSGSKVMPNNSLTGVSGNEIGIKSVPSGNVSVILTMVYTSLTGEIILTFSPSVRASFLASNSLISTKAKQ